MKLTLGKRIGFGFIILALISAISGGLILYWLSGLTTTSQSVMSVRTPSMLGGRKADAILWVGHWRCAGISCFRR